MVVEAVHHAFHDFPGFLRPGQVIVPGQFRLLGAGSFHLDNLLSIDFDASSHTIARFSMPRSIRNQSILTFSYCQHENWSVSRLSEVKLSSRPFSYFETLLISDQGPEKAWRNIYDQ
jgi:hypothetical protein